MLPQALKFHIFPDQCLQNYTCIRAVYYPERLTKADNKEIMKSIYLPLVWCAGDAYVKLCFNPSPLDKTAAISQTIFSDAISKNEKSCILNKVSRRFVPKGPIYENPSSV